MLTYMKKKKQSNVCMLCFELIDIHWVIDDRKKEGKVGPNCSQLYQFFWMNIYPLESDCLGGIDQIYGTIVLHRMLR